MKARRALAVASGLVVIAGLSVWLGWSWEMLDEEQALRKESQAGTRILESRALLLQSSGHHSGDSQALHLGTQGAVRLRRGMSIVGLIEDGPPVRLAHADTCHPQNPQGGSYTPEKSFEAVMKSTDGVFGGYAVVVHDSAVCGDESDPGAWMKGLGLNEWKSLEFRQPYVAILPSGHAAQEFLGPPSTLLTVLAGDIEAAMEPPDQRKQETLPRVAHAGGGINGDTYTNSLDALDHNLTDYRYFELDFSWTSDKELVCLHGWEYHFERTFDISADGAVTRERFESLVDSHSRYEQCTLSSLAEWLRQHPGKRIVTDIKEENLAGLAMIVERYPDLQARFVPQVYQPGEYFAARRLGFEDIIWTLYRYPGSDEDVLALLETMNLYGLTMTQEHAERGLAERAMNRRGVLSWVHTLNTQEDIDRFSALGVANIYTDWLVEG